MKFSISSLRTAGKCLKQYGFRYDYGYRSRSATKAQIVGTLVHLALEHIWKGSSYAEPVEQAYEKWRKELPANHPERGLPTVQSTVQSIIDGYIPFRASIKSELVAVEWDFSQSYPWGDELFGRIDRIERYPAGIFPVEIKTSHTIDESWARRLAFDLQCRGYLDVVAKKFGEKPAGMIFEMIRSEPPSPPRVLNNGKLSKDKNQSTTYELYQQAVAALPADQRSSYDDHLDWLQRARGTFYRRFLINRDEIDLADFETEFEALAGAVKSGARWRSPWACNWCEFFDICPPGQHDPSTAHLLFDVSKDDERTIYHRAADDSGT